VCRDVGDALKSAKIDLSGTRQLGRSRHVFRDDAEIPCPRSVYYVYAHVCLKILANASPDVSFSRKSFLSSIKAPFQEYSSSLPLQLEFVECRDNDSLSSILTASDRIRSAIIGIGKRNVQSV